MDRLREQMLYGLTHSIQVAAAHDFFLGRRRGWGR